MNPNDPNNLDPKLRETYERIMGGSPPQNTPQQPIQQTPISGFQTPPQPQQAPPPQMQTEQVNEPQPAPTLTPPPLQQDDDITKSPLSVGGETFVNPNPSASEVTEENSPLKPKKKGSLLPVFLSLGGLIFFVVYTIIWSKVFGLF